MLQGNSKTNWILVPIVGVCWFALYYFTFRFLITKFNVMTPGRGDDESIEDTRSNLVSKESLREDAVKIIAALGTAANIEEVDACVTRLRVSVKDPDKVDREALKALGATGVLDVKGGIQAIYGAKAILYKNHIAEILNLDD
nr:glucose PTS transporter subunit EIIB [Pseudobutyrivibrio sp. MD2005]